jgi:hypothetical protein
VLAAIELKPTMIQDPKIKDYFLEKSTFIF